MGRLTLNVLLSFAQFEREVTGERIRDKIAASKRKGMWMGGRVPLGYDLKDRKLIVSPVEAKQVREIFRAYLEVGCVRKLRAHLEQRRVLSKIRISPSGQKAGGGAHSRGALYKLLANRIYIGEVSHKGNTYAGEHEAIIDRELWEIVRAKLAENHRARRYRTNASEPSVLSGLIFGEDGCLYTPSHAVKKGKRYRYYVSRKIIHGQPRASTQPSRIPARELEQLVLTELRSFFGSADRVSAILGQAGEDLATTRSLVDAAQQFAKALAGDSTSGLRELLAGIVVRITIQQDSIEVHVSKERTRARLLNQERILGQDSNRQPIVLTIAMKLKRCGGEMRLIIPGWAAIDQRRQPVPSLIKAVSRASDWVRRMETGECKHQRDLAKAMKLEPRYINSILRVAFLAPEIVEAIIDGRQPPDLTLGSLTGVLPVSWQQQKKLISFS
jgi:site-specific DNA recombinase